jgi:hypothetical protein
MEDHLIGGHLTILHIDRLDSLFLIHKGMRAAGLKEVSILRQSRRLYVVSRSKRLERGR